MNWHKANPMELTKNIDHKLNKTKQNRLFWRNENYFPANKNNVNWVLWLLRSNLAEKKELLFDLLKGWIICETRFDINFLI